MTALAASAAALRRPSLMLRYALVPISMVSIASSCSSGDSSPKTPAVQIVDLSMYRQAFLEFKDCVADAGSSLGDATFDDSTQLYSYSFSPSVGDDCYLSTFAAVDQAWQSSDDRRKPAYERMSGAEITTECLVARGVVVEPDATPEELNALMTQYGVSMLDCFEEAKQNHP